MAVQVVATISLLTLSYIISSISAYNSLNCDYQGDCLCPDDILTFLCNVSAGAATVWKGSIFFNCPDSHNEITLRHSRYEEGISVPCNDGEVIAYSIESTNNSYISQLNVTVNPEMQNGTVECIQDGPGANVISIGACPFKLTFASESPDDAHFSYISPNQFTIEWSPPAKCPLVTYDIATTDCGECPNTTSSTSITCTNLTIDGQICSIVIQTRACGNHSDTDTANLTIELRAPSAPEVTARWVNQFASILTSFNVTERFFISDGIDGSATNYTIIYSDSTSERILCDSAVISALTCTTGKCNHMLDIPSDGVCSNISSITITIFATSILGDGPMSILETNKTFTHNQNISESESDHDALPITLYSIVGGSSIAVILFLLLVIIMLANFLKKVYKSAQRPSSIPEQVIYSETHPEPFIETNDERGSDSIGVHTQPVLDEDELLPVTESPEDTEESLINFYENNYNEIDKTLNLDTLLIQIRHEVTPKWYQFGLAVGINKETLDELSNFTPEECIVEISDLWLRTSVTSITWRDVADALKETGRHRLAERILKVYKIGILPVDQEAADAAMSLEQLSMTSNDQDGTSESDRPPLPPTMN